MNLIDRIKGAIYGHAIGDYLGMPVEFAMTPQRVEEKFGPEGLRPMSINFRGNKKAGYYTDDTAMMLCLAYSLVENGFDVKDQFSRYLKWLYEGYMSVDGTPFGIGQTVSFKLFNQNINDIPSKITNIDKEGGNGTLMKTLPIGLLYYKDMDKLIEYSILSSIVTHNNKIAAYSCVIFNTFIKYCLEDIPKNEFKERILKEKFFDELPKELKDVISNLGKRKKEDFNTYGYSLYTLDISLNAFFQTDNYSDSLQYSIFLGGDTDTQAAISGGLSGCYYGFDNIPKDWVEELCNREYFEDVYIKFNF